MRYVAILTDTDPIWGQIEPNMNYGTNKNPIWIENIANIESYIEFICIWHNGANKNTENGWKLKKIKKRILDNWIDKIKSGVVT